MKPQESKNDSGGYCGGRKTAVRATLAVIGTLRPTERRRAAIYLTFYTSDRNKLRSI
jgi:hypothetical protein